MNGEKVWTILLVEDDPGVATLQRRRLERAGFCVVSATTADEALAVLDAGRVDLAILDYHLASSLNGLDLHGRMLERGHQVPVIMVTGFSEESTVVRALRAGVRDFVSKSTEYLDYLPEAAERVLRTVQLERQLAESEARLAAVIASAKDAIISVDEHRLIKLFNPAAEKMFGCAASKARGRSLDDFIPREWEMAQHARGDRSATLSMRMREGRWGVRASGDRFPIEASTARMEVDGRRWHAVVVRDVTERQAAEERIREQAALLDQARDAIIVEDAGGRIDYWNRGAERVFGWTAAEAVGRPAAELLLRGSFDPWVAARRALAQRGEWQGELRQTTKDGEELVVESRWTRLDGAGRAGATLIIQTDVTERKRLEAQFYRAQRLESLGTLAGGIVHNLNNILTPIRMSLDLLRLELPAAQRGEVLDSLQESAARGSEMVQQILAFARGAEGQRVPFSVMTVVEEVEKLLRQSLPKSVRLSCSVGASLPSLLGDPTQVHQVLLNLCVNARDAMPDGGPISLVAAAATLDAASARRVAGGRPGEFVRLSVGDRGSGIPAAVKERIFEPFFTTKAVGAGTGLGLSSVQSIVKSHGGFVDVRSKEGVGTRFDVYLPVAPEGVEPKHTDRPAEGAAAPAAQS